MATTSIQGLAVNLTASVAGFGRGMTSAAGMIGDVRQRFDRATDAAEAYRRMAGSVEELTLAGSETKSSVANVLAIARQELARFRENSDVAVAIEVADEYLDESWRRVRGGLSKLIARSGLSVPVAVVADKRRTATAWLARQRKALTDPVTLRVEVGRKKLDAGLEAARKRVEALRRFRAVRISLAAVDATRAPVAAALKTLGPVRRLSAAGLTVALRATHYGIAKAVTKARKSLAGLGRFGSGIASSLRSGFALAGGALAAFGAYGFASFIRSSGEAIVQTQRVADRIGSSTRELSRLEYAASATGASVDRMQEGLNEMVQRLGEARTGTGSAADGLRMIGLSAEDLIAKSPAQAFGEISDAINALPTQADKVFAIDEIFGGDGRELIGLIQSGSAGMAKLGEEADRLGVSFDDVDAAQVVAATRATQKLQSVFTGIGRTLAIQFAPFVEAAADKLSGLATSGQGVGAKVVSAFEWVAGSVAYVSDYLSLVEAGFKMLQAGATYGVFGIVKSVDVLGKSLVDLINLLPGVEASWTDLTGVMADDLLDEARKLREEAGVAYDDFADGANARAVSRFFDDLRSKSESAAEVVAEDAKQIGGAYDNAAKRAENLEEVASRLSSLEQDVARFPLTDGESTLVDLEALGASEEDLVRARDLLSLRDRLNGLSDIDTGDPISDYAAKLEDLTRLWNEQKIGIEQFRNLRDEAKAALDATLADEAARVTESVRTPLEQYGEELEKLRALLDRGLISDDVFDRAVAKAKGELDGATGTLEVKEPETVRAGSAQANRLAYDAARGVLRTAGKDEVAKKSLRTQEGMEKHLATIARQTRNSGGVEITEVEL